MNTDIEKIRTLLRFSPSSTNIQPWQADYNAGLPKSRLPANGMLTEV